jgi:hypothetical protein
LTRVRDMRAENRQDMRIRLSEREVTVAEFPLPAKQVDSGSSFPLIASASQC